MIVIGLSAALTGLFLCGLGLARAGGVIRFLPYPVIGGFLGATGFLMVAGSQGMKHPLPRIRMLDGFNEGWIDFEGNGAEHRIGRIPLESVLKGLAAQA